MRTQVKQGFFVISLENMSERDQAQDYAGKRQLNQTVSRGCENAVLVGHVRGWQIRLRDIGAQFETESGSCAT
jgi:hypothetical protein